MDPVSAVSSIAGLVTLALALGAAVAGYSTSVSDAPRVVNELSEELALLGRVLADLSMVLGNKAAADRTDDNVLQRSLAACEVRLSATKDRLQTAGFHILSNEKSQQTRKRDKLAKGFERIFWPFKEKELHGLVESLRRLQAVFSFALTVEGRKILSQTSDNVATSLQLQLDTVQKIHDMASQLEAMKEAADRAFEQKSQLSTVLSALPFLENLDNEMYEIGHGVRSLEMQAAKERQRVVLEWLAPKATLQKHRDTQARRVPGSGQWFLEAQHFHSWVSGVHRDLIAVGSHGCGKSVLLSLVVDHLRERFADSDTAIAYFYCDYREQESQTVSHFMGSLLRQLVSQRNSIPVDLSDFYQHTRVDVKDQAWQTELEEVLATTLGTFGTAYVIVDALDETEPKMQRAKILSVLQRLKDRHDLKIFATCRPHTPSVLQWFPEALSVTVKANESDLRLYLAAAIDYDTEFEDVVDTSLREDIIKILSQNAHGMFLLPVLQIRSILDQVTKSDVRRTLQSGPHDLDAVFNSTIDRINSQPLARKNIASRTLTWLARAKRTLVASELQHALAVRTGDSNFDRDNVPTVKVILESCCGLVEADSASSTIRFAHYSVLEYLLQQQTDLCDTNDVHIAKTCLIYLNFDALSPLCWLQRAEFQEAIERFALLEYAASNWALHTQDLHDPQLNVLVRRFLRSSQHLLCATRARYFRSPDLSNWYQIMTPWANGGGAGVFVAASFGLDEEVMSLVHEGSTVNAQGIFGNTPLHEATSKGFLNTAQILLDHGAKAMRNRDESTPLFLAIAERHLEIADLLLSRDKSQADITGRDGFLPIHKAAGIGYEDGVTLLLKYDPLSMNSSSPRGHKPMHLAASKGYIEVVKQLVSAGAPINGGGHSHFRPLDHAVTTGHTNVAHFLLQNGATVNHHASDGWTPLHRACRGGHSACVSLLLEYDANILRTDRKRCTPLHSAARSGSQAVVSLLVNTAGDLCRNLLFARDKKGDTAKEVAYYCSHFKTYKYLRSAEAKILNEGSGQLDRLTAAIENGDENSVLTIIQEDGFDVNGSGTNTQPPPPAFGQPPLHVAMQEDNVSIARLLLEHAASIEQPGFHGWRPIHIAASIGSLPLVALCLEYKANISATTDSGQTPLHKAASGRNVKVVQLLIKAGADLEAENGHRMRALHIAAHGRHDDVVRLLLESGVEVDATDRNGNTAQDWAAIAGDHDLDEFLKEQGKARRISVRQQAREHDARENKTLGSETSDSKAADTLPES